MRRFPSLLLVFAVLMMTPVGVHTCGSLANSFVMIRGDDMPSISIEEAGTPPLQLTETAVTSYLFSPIAATAFTAVPLMIMFVFAVFIYIIPSRINKRKPPTPPPCQPI